MRCPRRAENPSSEAIFPGNDTWTPACSYCGSVAPEDFLTLVESGTEVGPTDKNYKVYVSGQKKFYFQHLDADQQRRFVELLNEKRVTIGYPGRFYVLPFFVGR